MRNQRLKIGELMMLDGEQGMAQWCERSPPTIVARAQILALTPYVG